MGLFIYLFFGAGLVEIEEGELTAQQLNLQSQALARTSFAREPHVQKVKLILLININDFIYTLESNPYKITDHTVHKTSAALLWNLL